MRMYNVFTINTNKIKTFKSHSPKANESDETLEDSALDCQWAMVKDQGYQTLPNLKGLINMSIFEVDIT